MDVMRLSLFMDSSWFLMALGADVLMFLILIVGMMLDIKKAPILQSKPGYVPSGNNRPKGTTGAILIRFAIIFIMQFILFMVLFGYASEKISLYLELPAMLIILLHMRLSMSRMSIAKTLADENRDIVKRDKQRKIGGMLVFLYTKFIIVQLYMDTIRGMLTFQRTLLFFLILEGIGLYIVISHVILGRRRKKPGDTGRLASGDNGPSRLDSSEQVVPKKSYIPEIISIVLMIIGFALYVKRCTRVNLDMVNEIFGFSQRQTLPFLYLLRKDIFYMSAIGLLLILSGGIWLIQRWLQRRLIGKPLPWVFSAPLMVGSTIMILLNSWDITYFMRYFSSRIPFVTVTALRDVLILLPIIFSLAGNLFMLSRPQGSDRKGRTVTVITIATSALLTLITLTALSLFNTNQAASFYLLTLYCGFLGYILNRIGRYASEPDQSMITRQKGMDWLTLWILLLGGFFFIAGVSQANQLVYLMGFGISIIILLFWSLTANRGQRAEAMERTD